MKLMIRKMKEIAKKIIQIRRKRRNKENIIRILEIKM
jgi:hypothetical protein